MYVKLLKATVKCVVFCVMIKNQAGNAESRMSLTVLAWVIPPLSKSGVSGGVGGA